jgi:ABC-2 type transport system ATP-binding protein
MANIVEVKDAYKRFENINILDGVSLNIQTEDKIALLGANGAGKTTLVRSILGFYHLDSGIIKIEGLEPIKDRVEVLKRVSFIPQTPPPIKLNIKELLDFIQKSSNTNQETIREYANFLKLDLDVNANKPFFKLSGGMKQKLLISIALAKRSKLLIFDEPTTSLDPKARESFYTLLKSLDYPYSALYITHRIEELEGLLNRKIYMELGKIVEDEKI